jgi:hypothetical protein
MRSYLYISDAKVDTLLPQFNTDDKRRIAKSLGIDVKIFNAHVDVEKLPLTNRIHRVEAVEAKLREDAQVGGLSGRTSWFTGSVEAMALSFGPLENAIFFIARNSVSSGKHHILGLGGSEHHVVGNIRPQQAASSKSHFHSLLQTLAVIDSGARGASVIRKNDEDLAFHMETGVSGTGNWLHILMELSNQLDPRQMQQISFVARRLVPDGDYGDGGRYTFATPLYISADDVY